MYDKTCENYVTITKKVPITVAERKKWKKFGASAKDELNSKTQTTFLEDEIKIQFIQINHKQNKENMLVNDLKKESISHIHCRICKGDNHWSVNCPYKELCNNENENNDLTIIKPLKNNETSNLYKPLSSYGVESSNSNTQQTLQKRDDCTVKISNLPEEVWDKMEENLRKIFAEAGCIYRFYLSMFKNVARCKGFAFCTYSKVKEAKKAVKLLDGYRFSHLVLKVEMAKS